MHSLSPGLMWALSSSVSRVLCQGRSDPSYPLTEIREVSTLSLGPKCALTQLPASHWTALVVGNEWEGQWGTQVNQCPPRAARQQTFRGTACLLPPPDPLSVVQSLFLDILGVLFLFFYFPHSYIYYLDFFCKEVCPFSICLFIQSCIYISMDSWIFIFILWLIILYYHYLFCCSSNYSTSIQLFRSAPVSGSFFFFLFCK